MASLKERDASDIHLNITTLPSLALERITSFLGRNALRNLRLTHSAFSYVATKALFSVCYLKNTEESAAHFDSIRGKPELGKWVKTVSLKTQEAEADRYSEEEVEILDAVKKSFLSSDQLPNLSSLALIFSEICAVDRGGFYWGDPPESVEFRSEVLQLLLQLYERVSSRDRIRSLSIKNLQNHVPPEFVESQLFQSLLSKLSSLELHIVSEEYEASPENRIWYSEVHDFGRDLPLKWFAHCSATLTNLVLFADHYIGFCPKIDLRGVHFPRLKSLALGNYTFSHDWQLDWLTAHGATLEELYMDDCGILYARHLSGDLDPEGYMQMGPSRNGSVHPFKQDKNGKWGICTTYERRWHHYFDTFAEHLQALRVFRFGHGVWYYGRAFERYKTLEVVLHDERYMTFNISIGPSQFSTEPFERNYDEPEFDSNSEVDLKKKKDDPYAQPRCEKEDREALERLLRRIGQKASFPDFKKSWVVQIEDNYED